MVSRAAIRVAAAALATVVSAAFSGTAGATQHRPAVALTSLEHGVLAQINGFREAHGLRPLRLSPQLTQAARQHSREMAADGYFAHDSANGGSFWQRIQRFYPSGSDGFWSVGENLLWSSPEVSAPGALELWENSPEHRANMLTARWREIGISAVHVDAGPGVFHGLPVTIVTTDFGVRH